ncbi:hypothetical protein AHAS_Ahas05G0065000 [Arachis hypogaea]
MAWSLGMQRVIIDMDYSEGLESINKGIKDKYYHNPQLQQIFQRVNKPWELKFQHVYREANQSADWMAKKGCGMLMGFHFIDQPPEVIVPMLSDDVIGANVPRPINSS